MLTGEKEDYPAKNTRKLNRKTGEGEAVGDNGEKVTSTPKQKPRTPRVKGIKDSKDKTPKSPATPKRSKRRLLEYSSVSSSESDIRNYFHTPPRERSNSIDNRPNASTESEVNTALFVNESECANSQSFAKCTSNSFYSVNSNIEGENGCNTSVISGTFELEQILEWSIGRGSEELNKQGILEDNNNTPVSIDAISTPVKMASTKENKE